MLDFSIWANQQCVNGHFVVSLIDRLVCRLLLREWVISRELNEYEYCPWSLSYQQQVVVWNKVGIGVRNADRWRNNTVNLDSYNISPHLIHNKHSWTS